MSPVKSHLHTSLVCAAILGFAGCTTGNGDSGADVFLGGDQAVSLGTADSEVAEVTFEDALQSIPLALEAVGQTLENVALDYPDVGFALNYAEARDYELTREGKRLGHSTVQFLDSSDLTIDLRGRFVADQEAGPVSYELKLRTGLNADVFDKDHESLAAKVSAAPMVLSGILYSRTGLELARFDQVLTRVTMRENLASVSVDLKGSVALKSVIGEQFDGQLEIGLARSDVRPGVIRIGSAPALTQLKLEGQLSASNPRFGYNFPERTLAMVVR